MRPPEEHRIEVRRAADRFLTTAEGRTTWHSFSFGEHYDPANVSWGPLVAHNEDHVQPGHGYDWHDHQGVEIVTCVLAGILAHEDSSGVRGRIHPGGVQRLVAGRGVRHTEVNGSATEVLRFVQVWLRPEVTDRSASYASTDAGSAIAGGNWVVLASGLPATSASAEICLDSRAALWAARPGAGATVDLPAAGRLHLYLARGRATLSGATGDEVTLAAGDAVRSTSPEVRRVAAATDALLLLWELPDGKDPDKPGQRT